MGPQILAVRRSMSDGRTRPSCIPGWALEWVRDLFTTTLISTAGGASAPVTTAPQPPERMADGFVSHRFVGPAG